jgi:FdhE protein
MDRPSHDRWLEQHSYLQPLADLQASLDAAAAGAHIPASREPHWDAYRHDFADGVPMLASQSIAIDWRPAGDALREVIRQLDLQPVPSALAPRLAIVRRELDADPDVSHRAIAALLEPAGFSTDEPGLWQLLGWDVVSRMFRDLVPAFGRWRDEERWLRPYCPTCGAAPAMAQLVGSDPGRMRLLSCGCCRTRWRYRRTGCPFCRTDDDHRLAGFAVEGEGRLRIDYCEQCRGYLKTYVGEGSETLLLADWTSLHLDVVARDKGLNRLADSLFRF